MFTKLPNYLEFRLFAVLASAALAIYLLQVLGTIFHLFSDIILILVLAWLLAFVIDPLVGTLTKRGYSRLLAAALVYSGLGVLLLMVTAYIIPATVNQLHSLVTFLPAVFSDAPRWAGRLETIATSALANSVVYAQTVASFLSGFLLVIVISFYLILSRNEIEAFLEKMIPQKLHPDYQFLRQTLNTTFASFLRVQLIIGLIITVVTIAVLMVLGVDFALSAGLLAGILAVIPVAGSILSIIPPALASATVSPEKAVISALTLFLIYQLVYNVAAPRLVGSALKIHPVVVIVAFIVGYKITGIWGAVFAVPIAVSVGIVAKELWLHWQREAG